VLRDGKKANVEPACAEGFGVAGAHWSRLSEAKEERPTSKSVANNLILTSARHAVVPQPRDEGGTSDL